MLLTNYHTHCEFCDGSGMPEDYIREALNRKFDAIGFSSHAPISFEEDWTMAEDRLPEYLNLIDSLKKKYEGKIEVYKGLEIDYLEGIGGPSSEKFNSMELDYTIGSVHMILTADSEKYLAVDGPLEHLHELLLDSFGGHIEQLTEKYYGLICEMIRDHKFDILGHLDLIKKRNSNNILFDETARWYREQVLETLDILSKSDVVLEVNTGGISRGYTESVYPSPWIIQEASVRNIPLMLNADAHNPEHVDFYYKESLSLIRECGYKELYSLYGGKWVSSSIDF